MTTAGVVIRVAIASAVLVTTIVGYIAYKRHKPDTDDHE